MRFVFSAFLVIPCLSTIGAEETKWKPIPEKMVEQYETMGGLIRNYSMYDGDGSFASPPREEDPFGMPIIYFDLEKFDEKKVPDAGVPFAVGFYWTYHGQPTDKPKEVPAELIKCLASMPNLVGLSFRYTTEKGFENLGNCKNLKVLDLNSVDISKNGMKLIAACHGLTGINFDSCTFGDEEFKSLKGVDNLRYLNFSQIKITDKSLNTIATFKELRRLGFFLADVGNELTPLAKLEKLSYLNVRGQLVGDAGIRKLKGMKSLKSLVVGSPKITGSIFAACRDLPNLTSLAIHEGVKDDDMKGIKELPALTKLTLEVNELTDKGIVEVKNLPNLVTLHLMSANLTDSGVVQLKSLSNLQELGLGWTKITDKGLAELKALKNLSHLDVSFTQVTQEGSEDFKKSLPKCKVDWAKPLR